MTYKEKTDDASINRDRIIVSSGINRFSERLKAAMQGMSNNELARKSGMSETTIRKYLKGAIFPGIDSAAIVADACGVSLVWLLCGIELKVGDQLNSSKVSASSPTDPILQRLSPDQAKLLSDAIIDHGVTGIISALNGMAEVNEFLQLSENERAQALRVLAMVKKGADQAGQIETSAAPAEIKKQAG